MKAGIYLGKEQIELRELPLPEVGDNDVLVQNLYSSVCGTDVAVFTHGPNTGHKVTVGGEFGHETVSRVVKVGKNVTDFAMGERVYPYPRYAKGDTKRAGTIGGFSEYILIPNAKRNHSLYAVDERISDRMASLIEPFTLGVLRRLSKCSVSACQNDYTHTFSASLWILVSGIPFDLINANELTKSAFYAWSEEARKEKENCDNGAITTEEFSRWRFAIILVLPRHGRQFRPACPDRSRCGERFHR